MASSQDYTTMPWATRCTLKKSRLSAASNAISTGSRKPMGEYHRANNTTKSTGANSFGRATDGVNVTVQRSNNEALIQQLAASHAIWRELEKRIETTEQSTRMRIAELEHELALSRKYEGAIKAVFFREFEREHEIDQESQRLDKKMARLEKKSRQVKREWDDLYEEELTFPERADGETAEWGKDDLDDQEVDFEVETRISAKTTPFTFGNVKQLFNINSDRQKWDLPKIDMKNDKVILLRRHDYYSGWLDAMRALDHQKATSMVLQGKKASTMKAFIGKETSYLYDRANPRNPRNAGVNAGLLFAWSALCEQHGMPERDVRLDGREWDLEDLRPRARDDHFGEFTFWDGMDHAKIKMEKLFKLKLERGIWETGEDAAQIALLHKVDMG